jgi:hypothetical protein
MRLWATLVCAVALLALASASGQSSALRFPETVEAGIAFSVLTTGSGPATLYLLGPGTAIRRKFRFGETLTFGSDDLHNAGHYIVFLLGPLSTENQQFENQHFDVEPSRSLSSLSFLAKPSRLAVNATNGIAGVVYLFDVFHNLVLRPQPVLFELLGSAGQTQTVTSTTSNGVAWVRMNSAAKAGSAQFQASVGRVREKRVIQQVPGDPCALQMNARGTGKRVTLETEPVRDCNGNPVPDGTIVTFTETFGGGQSTVDVPLKRGIARTEMPVSAGAVISVAAGVTVGNEIHWTARP